MAVREILRTEGLDWRHWAALVVAPTAWGARLIAGWAVAEIACDSVWAGSVGYFVVQTAITGTALVLVVISGIAAGRALGEAGSTGFDPVGLHGFLALSGVLAAVIYGALVVLEGATGYVVGC